MLSKSADPCRSVASPKNSSKSLLLACLCQNKIVLPFKTLSFNILAEDYVNIPPPLEFIRDIFRLCIAIRLLFILRTRVKPKLSLFLPLFSWRSSAFLCNRLCYAPRKENSQNKRITLKFTTHFPLKHGHQSITLVFEIISFGKADRE